MEGYVTTSARLRLYFQKIGDGPEVVVFPNGLYLVESFREFAAGRTLIFYDVRNRGRSDAVPDAAERKPAILKDVADLEVIRQHFGFDRVSLVGHSYIGVTIVLYAMRYTERVKRIVQLSPIEPHSGKQYPAELKWSDGVMGEVFGKIGKLQQERGTQDPEDLCRRFWALLRAIYVFDAANTEKINWGRCNLPNERNFMKYWSEDIFPSIQALNLTPEQLACVKAPALVVHGRKDRSAAYGGARDWALLLPDARLLTLENVAHAAWVEAPERVLPAIDTFLSGTWPESAEKVTSS